MIPLKEILASSGIWNGALEAYGTSANLTIQIHGPDAEIVFGPINPTPLFGAFRRAKYDPGMFAECAKECLEGTESPPWSIVQRDGVAVIGTRLTLFGKVVGAATAGYGLVEFSQFSAIQVLARRGRMPVGPLWDVVRKQQPMTVRQLLTHAELLEVLGDSLLRENLRTRQYEHAAEGLRNESEAKDRFLAVLSHELRNTLGPILIWAEMLKSGDADNLKRGLDVIERNARLQLHLVEDLLDLNRIRQGQVTLNIAEQRLWAILRSSIEAVQTDADQKGVAIEFTWAAKEVSVEGDGARLQQIFINILSNALKFTPRGGKVRIAVLGESESAVVKIRDNGDGIAPEFLPHAFEMFRQQENIGKRSHTGLGIGLAIVKSLVELHGGSVEMHSEGVGRGTEVIVRLPLGAPIPRIDSQKVPRDHLQRSPLQDLTVLLVEDMKDSREATQLILKRLGAKVVTARNGREALRQIRKKPVNLILCDLWMPEMDGFEFIHELRLLLGETHPPVIAVSGLASDADHARTRAAGFESHLDKPFNEAALVAAVIKAQKVA